MFQFTLIAAIIGLMLAVQLRSTKDPVVRDTRDIWELRQDLKRELQLQQQLLLEIRRSDDQLAAYEQARSTDQEAALRKTLAELKEEAGQTTVQGTGLILTIEPFYPESYVGPVVRTVSPELLNRLINELNEYGAKEIAVANTRLTNTTAIRDVNGLTKVGNVKISSFPLEVKIIADDVSTLHHHLKVSPLFDDFVIENLQLTVSEPISTVVIPQSEEKWHVRYLQTVNAEKGGE
ncbi:hypothetical protein GFC30_1424 [Anoxybacillus amylolyticus]|uniref:DUF881 domain-containing protein n=2 Tax=Anoxybacteroides amylolyticum TaxID=294699 RepID=A0A160F2N0_9BACL|nr:hypothetical protein GFC30_1424 [Anoxybacillus amylolyticus]